MDDSFIVQRAPYKTIPNGHRLYSTLLKFVVALDTVMIALIATHDPEAAMQTARKFSFSIREGEPSFEIDTHEPTSLVLRDIEPNELAFRHANFDLKVTPKADVGRGLDTDAIRAETPRLVLYMRFVVETTASLFMTLFASYD